MQQSYTHKRASFGRGVIHRKKLIIKRVNSEKGLNIKKEVIKYEYERVTFAAKNIFPFTLKCYLYISHICYN